MIPEDPDEEVSRNSSKLASFEQRANTASKDDQPIEDQQMPSDNLLTPQAAVGKDSTVEPKGRRTPDKGDEAPAEGDKSARRLSVSSKKSPRTFKKPVPALKAPSAGVAEASEATPQKSARKVPVKKPKPGAQAKASSGGSGIELLMSFALTAGQVIGAGLALVFGLAVAGIGFIAQSCCSGKRGGGAQPANMFTSILNIGSELVFALGGLLSSLPGLSKSSGHGGFSSSESDPREPSAFDPTSVFETQEAQPDYEYPFDDGYKCQIF